MLYGSGRKRLKQKRLDVIKRIVQKEMSRIRDNISGLLLSLIFFQLTILLNDREARRYEYTRIFDLFMHQF